MIEKSGEKKDRTSYSRPEKSIYNRNRDQIVTVETAFSLAACLIDEIFELPIP